MVFDPHLHHRRSIRIKGHDYTSPGAYFVTIVAAERKPIFGSINDGFLELNSIGQVALLEWERLSARFPSLSLNEFVVMPNHIHGILVLADVEHSASSTASEQFGKPRPGSIATIVRSYKSAVALRINRLRGTPCAPVWQANYYDRIIRNESELDRIRQYIHDNPTGWETDQENPSKRSPHTAGTMSWGL